MGRGGSSQAHPLPMSPSELAAAPPGLTCCFSCAKLALSPLPSFNEHILKVTIKPGGLSVRAVLGDTERFRAAALGWQGEDEQESRVDDGLCRVFHAGPWQEDEDEGLDKHWRGVGQEMHFRDD